MFQNFKNCLFNKKTVYRSQERFESYNHDVYTEKISKIALSNNDDKRLQIFDGITTYTYGRNALKRWRWNANGKRFIFWKITIK